MGFYGNITNTSKTTFTFDKIYKNRQAMDLAANSDGVFLGRYVLVEYGMTANQYIIGYLDNGQMYDDPTNRDADHIIPWEINKIVKVYQYNRWYLYQATQSGNAQRWTSRGLFTNDRKDDAEYKANYDIDYPIYGRGYDSTVWIKQYLDNEEKYVQIAELNTVVPIFSICPLLPEDPYVVAENVNYEPDTYYYYSNGTYVLDSGATQTEGRVYYAKSTVPPAVVADTSSTNLLYKLMVPTNYQLDLDDNQIYFNKAGFDKTSRHYDSSSEDVIKYTLSSSKYSNYYDVEQDSITGEVSGDDRKSLVINLPSLGNAVCNTYDLLYGKDRQDNNSNYDNTNVKGALNTLNAKMNLKQLEANKLIYLSSDVNSNIGENYMKSADIVGDSLISVDEDIEKNNGKIIITHKDKDEESVEKTYGSNQTFATFGSSITLPSLKIDRAGHIVDDSTFTISIPKGSYTPGTNGNVITALSYTPTTGALSSTLSHLGDLKLNNYTTNSKLNSITKDSTLSGAINGLIDNSDSKYNTLLGDSNNNFSSSGVPTLYSLRAGINTLNAGESSSGSVDYKIKQAINNLDYSYTKKDNQFITAVSETDGIISVEGRALEVADLPITFDGTYSSNNKVATQSSLAALKTTILGSANSTNTVDKAIEEAGKKIDETGVRALTYGNSSDSDKRTVSELYDMILVLVETVNNMSEEITSLKNNISTLQSQVKTLEDANKTTTE